MRIENHWIQTGKNCYQHTKPIDFLLKKNQVEKGKCNSKLRAIFKKGNDEKSHSWLRPGNLRAISTHKHKHIFYVTYINGSNYKFLPMCKSCAHAIFFPFWLLLLLLLRCWLPCAHITVALTTNCQLADINLH